MTEPGPIEQLVARLQAATGPDAEIDLDLWCATADRHNLTITQGPFTASLDAALALVERVRPGWRVSVMQVARGWEGVLARNFTGRADQGPHEVRTGIAPTPAIVLCLALLRTLETQNG